MESEDYPDVIMANTEVAVFMMCNCPGDSQAWVDAEKLSPDIRPDSDLQTVEGKDLLEATVTYGKTNTCWTRGEPITEAGKRRQMARMLTLILTPIMVLMAVSFYFVSDNITAKMESDKVKSAVLFSVEVGKVIHAMQSERDLSVLYLSSIGPETKSFLTSRYLETDEQLADLPGWPAGLTYSQIGIDQTVYSMIERDSKRYYRLQPKQYSYAKMTYPGSGDNVETRVVCPLQISGLVTYEMPQFNSKRAFQQYLTRHRNELDLLNHTLYDEINFYTDNIRVFVRWLYDAIKESKYGTIWKTLVAYQKVVEAKEHVGIERAVGSAFFSTGGFVSQQIYEWYNRELHAFRANVKSAERYSSRVGIIANSRISSGGANLTNNVELFRRMVQRFEISAPSLRNATLYFDNMTLYIDLVFLAVKDLADEIVAALDERAENVSLGVVRSSIIIFVVLVMCPILVKTMRTLTDDIQKYALTLVDKTKELNQEKRRTDSLLYQMLPKPVAERLKYNRDVKAEYFNEVTVSFCDIVEFCRMTREYSPSDLILLLNSVMALFDERIEQYDVFKVDTVGDAYVLASGLPERNGSQHAVAIANVALDVLELCQETSLDHLPDRQLSLRIGIHTGPCSAGLIAGGGLPRYCLFGDTTTMAAMLENLGLPNRTHISSSTYRLLNENGGYSMAGRGKVEIKGRGMVHSYWLLSRKQRRPKRLLPRIDAHSASTTSSIADVQSNHRSESLGDVSDSGVSDAPARQSPSHSGKNTVGQQENRHNDVTAATETKQQKPPTEANPTEGDSAPVNIHFA